MEEKKLQKRRPRKIASPDEFDDIVDRYIAECEEKNQPALLTGMLIALGFDSKNTFYLYMHRPEFESSVKRASMLIEHEYEKRLNSGMAPTAPIFALKNFGWTDSQKVDHTSSDGSMTPKEIVFTVVDNDAETQD